ncbi:MAG: fibronectin type III domain-containing protein [Cyanobacteria bacterium SID2]|nr:fibronectin type III domain-containing protein [Cyanobacteria bacterium SID2]MBP0004002.1 fibronectin type III domain-containing protein [Cyanobacteria bacterium SBC]
MRNQISIAISGFCSIVAVGTLGANGIAVTSERLATGAILQIEGDVAVQRDDGRSFAPELGTLLYPGDRLQIASGRAIVQCQDLSVATVTEADWTNACQSDPNTSDCSDDAVRCPHRGDEIAASNSATPYIIAPRRTNLLDDRPTLRWNPVPGATRYTVRLREDGLEIWRGEATSAQIEYPEDAPSLQPGAEYLLVVRSDTGQLSLEPAIPGGFGFRILDTELAERVRWKRGEIEVKPWNSTAKTLAIARLYQRYGLISEAVAMLENTIENGVESAALYGYLGQLYWDYLALESLAIDRYCQALKLANPEDLELREAAIDRVGDRCSAVSEN